MKTQARLAAAALTAACGLLFAGPLNPPAGPVAATYKTLAEVEPRTAINATNTPTSALSAYTIVAPGSYYLTDNITAPTGKCGIMVTVSDVTIDLNGFAIRGDPGCTYGTFTGGNSLTGVTIKNGTIVRCVNTAIDLHLCSGSRVSGVIMEHNSGAALSINDGIVDHCEAFSNHSGFESDSSLGTFQDCVATWNTMNGFTCTNASLIERCTASNNGSQGFYIGAQSTIRDCQAFTNAGQGIVATSGSLITGNSVWNNGSGSAAGIWLSGTTNIVKDNESADNGYGIYAGGSDNVIIRNHVGYSSHTNFHIVAGNFVGTIVMPSGNAALIDGNSGGGLGTSDPNANIVY
jgi:parallel beta-helix repeat protein